MIMGYSEKRSREKAKRNLIHRSRPLTASPRLLVDIQQREGSPEWEGVWWLARGEREGGGGGEGPLSSSLNDLPLSSRRARARAASWIPVGGRC